MVISVRRASTSLWLFYGAYSFEYTLYNTKIKPKFRCFKFIKKYLHNLEWFGGGMTLMWYLYDKQIQVGGVTESGSQFHSHAL